MAGAFVQQKEFSENRSVASNASISTGAFGAALTAGNLMTATVSYTASPDTGARTLNLSGGGSPTWNAETPIADGLGNYVHNFYAMNIPGGTTAAVVCAFSGLDSGNVQYPAIHVREDSGYKTSGARLAFVSNVQATPTTSTDATTSGATGTLGNQPAGIIGGSFNSAGVATPAAGTGFTARSPGWTYEGVASATLRPEDKRVTSTTSTAATFTAADNSTHVSWTWAFDEVSGSPAVISSPTPSGTIGTTTTVGLGGSTDQTTGTAYGVIDTASLAGITAAQIKAGQNASSVAAISAGNSSVSASPFSIACSGLTPATAYNYAIVQNNANGDSNVIFGTFTTAAASSGGRGLLLLDAGS